MNSRTSAALIALSLIAGAAGAQSTQAVEWKVSEGGNGHWYGLGEAPGPVTQAQAQDLSRASGGHLLSGCGAEFDFAVTHTDAMNPRAWSSRLGPWIGLSRLPASPVWRWIDGTACTFDRWDEGQPNNGDEIVVLLYSSSSLPQPFCHDITDANWSRFFIVEWDADCNGDGIVDYGQIQRGEFADLNGNGVPDVCEVSVSGVTPPSVPSQGGSTITIRGTNFQGTPSVKIGGVPATNVVTVSPISLTATSPALLPGMVSVAVNGFTLQEALYIRPECGSDLDQNGSVDAGDIAIILLDFGPCYSTVVPATPEDSRPFMLREEAAPAAPQSR